MHVTRMVKNSNGWMILIKSPRGERRVGKPRCRWKYNIKINFKEKEDIVGWIHLAFIGASGFMCEDCIGFSSLQIRERPCLAEELL